MKEKQASNMTMAKHAMMTCINLASLHVSDAVEVIKKTKYYHYNVKKVVNQMNDQALKVDHITMRLMRNSKDPKVYLDAMDAAQDYIEPRLKSMITDTRAMHMQEGIERHDVTAELFIAGLLASMALEGLQLLRKSVVGGRFSSETEADLAVLNPKGLCQSIAKACDVLLIAMGGHTTKSLMDEPKIKSAYMELCELILSKRFIQAINKYADNQKSARDNQKEC